MLLDDHTSSFTTWVTRIEWVWTKEFQKAMHEIDFSETGSLRRMGSAEQILFRFAF